ncbi:hypothetical protein BN8_01707 [Fibrisoma limi BUZ 3]|uniref:Lipoprotein n=2 Tax=Fibrisoma limi TaxID=663275 RepID=I2GFL4_9BACT|nr:hypothetical protein BN8_01707 [Fibrisoma limi BUZ 3]
MLKRYFWVVLSHLIMLIVSISCQRNNEEPAPNDTDYFPLQVGAYWVYQVTHNQYSENTAIANRMYQLQEKITGSFNQNGQVVFLLEESIRQNEKASWKLTGIRTVYSNLTEVVAQENNVPTVRLVFPISVATSWNNNLYNSKPDTLLQYRDMGRSFSAGKRLFDNTISVVGPNDSTLIDQSKYLRVYARHVGLIYREDAMLTFCQSQPECIGKGVIESGNALKWELISSSYLP